MRKLLAALLLSIIAAGCGTGVYHHRIEISLNDPTKRLGDGPVEVSIFDNVMGYSDEWARRTMGTASPGTSYSGTVSDTDTKMVYDRTPPERVQAGLAVPALEKGGFFVLHVKPAAGSEVATTLPYKSYLVSTAEEDRIQPLTARVTGTPSSKGWTLHVTVDVPPAATAADPKKP
jgi:hypothetical protein